MNLFVRFALIVTFVGLQVLVFAHAQEETSPFRGETTVNVVEVPVAVYDRKTGEPVVGLTEKDFEIRENDVVQRITNFAEMWRSEDDAAAGGGFDPESPEAEAEADELRTRTVELVYLFDLFLMNKIDRDRALDGLRSAYQNGVPEGQNVSLVAFDGALEVVADRVDDRFDVLDALEEIGYIKTRGLQQSVAFSDQLIGQEISGERDQAFYERRQRNREFIGELEKRVLRVGDAAVATMSRYAKVDGRRVLVIFTPGHPTTEWSPTYSAVDFVNAAAEYPVHDLWQPVAHEAADLGFTLFTVDSSGVRVAFGSDVGVGVTDALESAVDRGSVFVGQDEPAMETEVATDPDFAFDPGGSTQNLGSWLERTRKSMLILASDATGGGALFTREVVKAVDQVNEAVSHYYSVAYTADHAGDGATYAIEVELPNHPDYRVVHRTGYVDQPAAVRSGQRLRSAMLFGEDANPLGVKVEVGEADSRFRLGAAGSKRLQIPLHIKIPYGRLEMIQRGDLYWSKLWITLFAEDAAGNQSALASHEQPVTVEADNYQEAMTKGYFSYHTTVEIEGAEQSVYVGIQEELSGRTTIMPLEFP